MSDVSDPASELGLVALAGSARDVGVTGYTLGGGLSFLTLYRTDDYARLREVKSSYDPGAVFRGNHDIPAA